MAYFGEIKVGCKPSELKDKIREELNSHTVITIEASIPTCNSTSESASEPTGEQPPKPVSEITPETALETDSVTAETDFAEAPETAIETISETAETDSAEAPETALETDSATAETDTAEAPETALETDSATAETDAEIIPEPTRKPTYSGFEIKLKPNPRVSESSIQYGKPRPRREELHSKPIRRNYNNNKEIIKLFSIVIIFGIVVFASIGMNKEVTGKRDPAFGINSETTAEISNNDITVPKETCRVETTAPVDTTVSTSEAITEEESAAAPEANTYPRIEIGEVRLLDAKEVNEMKYEDGYIYIYGIPAEILEKHGELENEFIESFGEEVIQYLPEPIDSEENAEVIATQAYIQFFTISSWEGPQELRIEIIIPIE